MNPTDPMTPVRALLDTVHDDTRVYGDPVLTAARAATASISQLLSEHDKVVEYIKELRADRGATEGYDECADRLQSIVEGK